MMKTELTIEESARLLELGVDAKLASKCQVQHEADFEVEYRIVPHDEFCYEMASLNPQPIFDIGDILTILPKEMNFNGVRVSLQMYQHLAGYWIASYVVYSGNELIHQNPLCAEKELIDALYQLLIWCLENGHLKTEKE